MKSISGATSAKQTPCTPSRSTTPDGPEAPASSAAKSATTEWAPEAVRLLTAISVLFIGCLCGVIAASPGFNGADLMAVLCITTYLWAVWPYLRSKK